MLVLIAALWLGLGLWILLAAWNWIHASGYVLVSGEDGFPLSGSPKVSILIPSRNEMDVLPASLPRFLGQNYDDYEVILVDDGSSDGTREWLAPLAREHEGKLRVIRLENPPPGWTGKNYALHRAFEQATGEWVLATDADILFHPNALRAGLWIAGREQAELVSIYAFMECRGFWERVLLPGFALLLASIFPAKKINDPASSVALASGGYILMRRNLWASLGGYERIRSEMIDDLNTARIVKHSGHRIFVAATRDLLRTRMYGNFREIWEGLRKNAFAGHRFSVAKLMVTTGGSLLCNLLPLIVFVWTLVLGAAPEPLLFSQRVALALASGQLAISVLLHIPILHFLKLRWAYALMVPIGAVLYSAITLDSMFRTLAGRGVSWKNRQYRKTGQESPDA